MSPAKFSHFFFFCKKNRIVNILLLISIYSFSQKQNRYHFTIDQGLASNETYSIHQDKRGYIWVATDKGVSRYDGYSFKNYTTKEGLGDDTVFKFYEDYLNRIWFLSYNGKLSYYHKGKIYQPKHNLDYKDIDHLISMYVDKNDNLWFGSKLGEFKARFINKDSLVVSKTKEQYSFRQIDTSSRGYIYSGISHIILTKENKEKRTYFIKLSSGEYYLERFGEKSYKSGFCKVKQVKKGSVQSWLLYKGVLFYSGINTLNLFNSNTKEQKKKTIHDNSFSYLPIIKNKEGYAFCDSPHKKLYPINLDSITIGSSENTMHDLTDIVKDNQNGIWISTLDSGVYYQPESFIKVISSNLYGANVIVDFASTDALYLRSNNNSIFKYSKKGIQKLKTFENNRLNGSINSFRRAIVYHNILEGRTKYLEKNNEINVYNKKGGTNKLIAFDNDNYTMFGAKAILMFGENDSLILKEKFYKKKSGNFIKKIKTVCYKNKNTLYVGTLRGLLTINRFGDIAGLGSVDPLFNTRIEEIKKDSFGRFWLATKGAGVILIDKDKIINISAKQGLLSSICNKLYIGKKRVWIATEKGLSGISLFNIRDIDNFTKKDGLISNQVNAVHEFNNQVWTASDIGVSYFSIDYKKKEYPPLIYINNIETEEEVKDLDNIIINPKENILTINYSGISLRAQGNLTYKYRLKGLDSTWYLTPNRSVQYSTLPKGHYEFEIKSVNKENITSVNSQTLKIIKQPFFWETLYFIIPVIVIFILIIILSISFRFRVLKKREYLKRRAIQAELKLLRSQMNPHFTFNAMNSIQYYIQQNNTNEALEFIHKFSRLIRLTLQNTQKETITLYEELEALTLYMKIEQERLNYNFRYLIKIEREINQTQIKIPPMLLQPYVENAIWHGIMNKADGKGVININIRKENNRVVCEIIDDGVGVEASKKNQNKIGKSIGMKLLEERLSLINRTKINKQKVEVNDLLDVKNEICGTKVKLIL